MLLASVKYVDMYKEKRAAEALPSRLPGPPQREFPGRERNPSQREQVDNSRTDIYSVCMPEFTCLVMGGDNYNSCVELGNSPLSTIGA